MNERIAEAQKILQALGLPAEQQNERAALTLLALLDLPPGKKWGHVANPLLGITPIMAFVAQHYQKQWAPNTRETVRRFTIHQFLAAGLVVANPDKPDRAVNSPHNAYQIEPIALELIRSFGTSEWQENLTAYGEIRQSLVQRYAHERAVQRIPIQISSGREISLSPGGQNILIQKILEEFAPIFTPGAKLLYVGDTDSKFSLYEAESFLELGITLAEHGKMPDVILHVVEKGWLVLVEAVTSHGPIHSQRHEELGQLFRNSVAGLVFVTAFLDRQAFKSYLPEIAWETEVWVADAPTHLIHFNGERFLGPYNQ
jgi:type II restriction enzyme